MHWPTLSADEAAEEWDRVLGWVHEFMVRYPNGVRIPECWWRHTDLVEALSALRDHERESFGPSSPAGAAVEWQRARRDVENLIDTWIKRLPCAIAGRGHPPMSVLDVIPDGWHDFVASDVARRRAIELN